MLDTDTKRRIDTARDILVGKVPDPKSQVEQITIALIYKFMDDMDAETEELGGERSFFSGEFARFRWPRLMALGLGGFEMLTLYGEAIAKMPENPGIPALFRDIFKNAYLPYRDPETLKSFLKIIGDFRYDHSERLGDAFEYLLSVLGSQGDAGQFRTPRHIIDFMVDVIDPHKDERVLDPACGTAGFLISTYKHVMAANAAEGRAGSGLTPDERKRLLDNIRGYDISPDMVRLSLVNLYLHGFVDPHIVEYDTLTSEERWNEHYDIILANPPFMSPKGGIRPHKRFSVQSGRSEVLFVDYIAEHLSPAGRAAIIVPEGVIFQSGTAYKTLRKMLVEGNYLLGVISLPAGVFQPYSGVKTSILWIDRALARRTDKILFVKVENDGFDLGAQRRAIEKNDLPAALAAIGEYKRRVAAGEPVEIGDWPNASAIEKARLAESSDYNLSGERYRQAIISSTHYPLVALSEVATINPSKKELDALDPMTAVSFVPMADVSENNISFTPMDTKPLSEVIKGYTYFRNGDVLVAKITPCFENGKAGIARNLTNGIGLGSTEFYVIRSSEGILPELIYFYITSPRFREGGVQNMTGSAGQQRVPRSFVEQFQIPLPPLDVQAQIVAEIEGYQKIIDGARQVIENYRPRIKIDPAWPVVRLGEVCEVKSGGTPSRNNGQYWNGNIPWVTTTLINFNPITAANEFISQEGLANSSTQIFPSGTVLLAMYGQGITRGKVGILAIDAAINQACAAFVITDNALQAGYLYRILESRYVDLRRISDARGGNQSNLSATMLKEYEIPLPDISAQHAIIAQIEHEQALIAANRELIILFERKIKDRIAMVWGG